MSKNYQFRPRPWIAPLMTVRPPCEYNMRTSTPEYRWSFAPLGVPTLFIADDPAALDAACSAYLDWRTDAPPAKPVITIALVVGPDCHVKAENEIRVDGSRLTLRGEGIHGRADAKTGRAHAVVPRRLCGEPIAMAREVIDTLLLFLLARSGRPPLHAAGVMLDGTALLLAGPSGSGKSTLSLAAFERGLEILSDDTVYIQLHPRVRVWGLGGPVHVFPKDAPGFNHATRLRGGKLKAVVPLAGAAPRPRAADKATLVLLERGDDLHLERIGAESAISALLRLAPGFDLLPNESASVAGVLATNGAWRLTLARDPRVAIEFLCRRLQSIG